MSRPISSESVYQAIAHPTRRKVLDLLRRGDRAASHIAGEFRHTKATMSAHLRILEAAGMIHQRREGRFRVYSLRAAPIRQAAVWMRQF